MGKEILASIEDKTAAELLLQGKQTSYYSRQKCAVKIDGLAVQIDPRFQRLTVAARATDSMKDILKLTCAATPPTLFDSTLLLQEPQTPVLANAIWALLTPTTSKLTGEVQ